MIFLPACLRTQAGRFFLAHSYGYAPACVPWQAGSKKSFNLTKNLYLVSIQNISA